MSRNHATALLIICVLLSLSVASSATRSITLSVDSNGVNNTGSDTIEFDWNVVFDTTCSSLTFQIIGPSPATTVVVSQNVPCGASPRTGGYDWTPPAGQAPGLYTAKLTFNSHWNGDAFCCPADFQDLAQVQFRVCCAGRLRFCKFLDLTGNGVKDPSDTPLAG